MRINPNRKRFNNNDDIDDIFSYRWGFIDEFFERPWYFDDTLERAMKEGRFVGIRITINPDKPPVIEYFGNPQFRQMTPNRWGILQPINKENNKLSVREENQEDVEIINKSDEVIVLVEVHNADPKSISVTTVNNVLTINAKVDGEAYFKQVSLPIPIRFIKNVSYKNGILTVTLQK